MHKKIVLALMSVLLAAPAAAQVYKWVDGAGVTHYSEKPPETGKSKEVQLHGATPAGASPNPGLDASLQERDRAFRQRQAAREQDEAKQAKDRARLEQQCKSERNALADMRQISRLYEMNDKGERVFLTDAQRDEKLASRQAEYDKFCK